jgi:hypothetical protein
MAEMLIFIAEMQISLQLTRIVICIPFRGKSDLQDEQQQQSR